MEELKDKELLAQYIQEHKMNTIFNEPLLKSLSLYAFRPEETICLQGEIPDTLFILVKGKIKIYTTSPEGRKLIIDFKLPLEVIGDIEYVQDIELMNTVESVTAVHMIGIKLSQLKKYGDDHAPLLQFLLKIITEKFFIKSNSLSFNLMHPVEVRLASYLLSASFEESNGCCKGKLSTSNLVDVADLIGTSYRHLNRVIQRFCSEGLLQREKGLITIKDHKRLSKLADLTSYKLL